MSFSRTFWLWMIVLLASVAWSEAEEATTQPAPLVSNAGSILGELAKQARDPTRPALERLELVTALGRWASPEVREPLIALLTDPLVSIRAAAARGLGWPGHLEAVSALRERVEAPGEAAPVRAVALEALGAIGDRSARGIVLAATSDPDPAVRGAALSAVTFGALVDPADRTALLIRVAGDDGPDLQLRAQAIQALGTLRDLSAVPVLTRVLEQGPRIRMPLPSAGTTQQEIMALRFRQARDVRAWAAKALGGLRERAAVPLLLRTAEDPDDFFLRLLSVGALASYRAPEALPVLERRLEDPFPMVRVYALAALTLLGDQRVVSLVAAKLDDEDSIVRAQAIIALTALGARDMRPRLEALRGTEADPEVQRVLETALSQLAP